MSYDATNWPPLQIPPPVAETGIGETVTNTSSPPNEIVQQAPYNQEWTASPPPVDNTRPVTPNYQTVRRQIDSYFGIISSNPGTNNPNNNIVPGGDIPT